jgi:hypothetical protein
MAGRESSDSFQNFPFERRQIKDELSSKKICP